jgi:hypothetical protein
MARSNGSNGSNGAAATEEVKEMATAATAEVPTVPTAEVPAIVPPVTAGSAAEVPTDNSAFNPFAAEIDVHADRRGNTKAFDVDIYAPDTNTKGEYVSKRSMQSKLFRKLAAVPRSHRCRVTVTSNGARRALVVVKHASAPCEDGAVWGYLAFNVKMADGTFRLWEPQAAEIVRAEYAGKA